MISLLRDGAEIRDDYLSPSACATLLEQVRHYSADRDLPLIERFDGERALRYRVIDGESIYESLPAIVELYHDVLNTVRQYDPRLEPLSNRLAGLNVNVTPPGGEYRWHYDRNSVTAILFLNVVRGGQTEMYPHCRVHLGRWKDTFLQRAFDHAVGFYARRARPIVVEPRPGRLILMRADRCLHSVCKVEGSGDRVTVIMAFDRPGAVFQAEKNLDSYLYSSRTLPRKDPNYR